MSQINSINEVIKENSKNKFQKENIENNINNIQLENIIEKNENDSFNQLLSLQLLIQKHSGLKGLCKKNS